MTSVILPIYRNAKTLPELCARLAAVLAPAGGGSGFEILLVIDASPDNSLAVANDLAAMHPHIKVVDLARNVGQSRTILTGLAHAAGSVAVVMDADLQDPPEALPALLHKLDSDPKLDAVFATRINRYSTRGKHITSRLFKTTMRLLSRGRIPPNAGLFLALRRDLYQRMTAHSNRDVHLVGLVSRTARRTAAVPVPRELSTATNYTSAMRLAVAFKSFRTLLGIPRRNVTPIEIRSTRNLSPAPVSA